jgi:hypothetical protein
MSQTFKMSDAQAAPRASSESLDERMGSRRTIPTVDEHDAPPSAA